MAFSHRLMLSSSTLTLITRCPIYSSVLIPKSNPRQILSSLILSLSGSIYGGTGAYFCRGVTPATRSASLLRVLPKKLYRVELEIPSPNILLNSKFNVLKMERNVIDLSFPSAQPHPPIRRKKAGNLSHDQRRDIQLLHSLGWKYDDIHKSTGCEISQIR